MPTRELTTEEADALTKDLREVLEKHGCEMGVKASIEILKYETGDAQRKEAKAD